MSISFSGLASGLDTSSWVQSLVALKQAKVTTLEKEKEEVLISKDTLNSIRSFFSSFRSTIERITDSKFNIVTMDMFAQNLATSANLEVFTASATTDAEEATYNIKVDKLASNTKAVSTYKTTVEKTTTATTDSLLKHIGVTAGDIGVTVDGVKYGVTITESETIGSFIEKLKAIGVEASFNNHTGVFSMNLNPADIDDTIDYTGIVDKLALEGVNEGYKTLDKLEIETVETVWDIATNDTLLSALGVNAGTMVITANGFDYDVTVDDTTTIGEFVSALQANGIDAAFDENIGIFTLSDAEITNEGGTNVIDGMKLQSEIYSVSQKTEALLHQTIITQTTTATSDTLLKDIGTGTAIADGQTVIVKNSNNELTTINVGTATTIGDLLSEFTNAGLYAEINSDGIIEISGGSIVGGTFDAVAALGLETEPFTAMTTGDPLTETIIEYELVTYDTRLVDDLGVTEGYLAVEDPDGNTYYQKIYSGQTIGDLMADLANNGIYSTLDMDTGILEITGGAFTTLTDADVLALVANNTIAETDARYQKGTNLLECLYGAGTISTDQISVASAYSRTQVLTKHITTIVDATLATTLGTLGLSGNGTATFDARGESKTINVTTGMTVQGLMDALAAQGIESSWDSDFSRITINNCTLTGGTSNLDDVLNLTTEVTGKYVTSDELHSETTIIVDATGETLFEELGVTTNEQVVLVREDGTNYTFNITGTTTMDSFLNTLNSNGVTAKIEDGIFSIDGGYIVNAAIEEALGLERAVFGYSQVLGNKLTHTIITTATGDSTVGDVITALGTTAQVAGGYNMYFNSHALNVNADTTIDNLMMQIYDLGGTSSIDVAGRLHIDGGTLTGTVAEALGFSSVTTTDAVSATGETLATITTVFADTTTKLSALGLGDSTITIKGDDSVELGTIQTHADMTIADLFTALAAYGIKGSISNGVITLKSDNNAWATGGVLDSMGVGNTSTTYTTTAGVTNSSSSEITFTYTVTAIGSSTMAELGLSGDVTIKGIDGVEVGSIAVDSDMTMTELFAALAAYDIEATISGGVVSMESKNGNYAEGGVVAGMNVGTSTSTTTQTIGTEQSSNLMTHFYTVTAIGSTTMGELGLSGDVTIKGIDGVEIGSIAVDSDMTMTELFAALAAYDIEATVSNGIVYMESKNGNYAEGGVVAGMNMQTSTSTTTQTIGTEQSSNLMTHFYTVTANGSTTMGELGLSGDVTVKGVNGEVLGSVAVDSDMTMTELFAALAAYGIESTISGGVVSMESRNGNYAEGGVVAGMNMATSSTTTTQTIGTSHSSSALTTSNTITANGSTTFGEISITGSATIYGVDGEELGSIAVGSDMTIDSFLAALAAYGIEGSMTGGVVTLESTNGAYATGDVITALGIGTTSTTTTQTIGTSHSSSALTTSNTITANGSTTFGEIGISGSATIYGVDGEELGTVAVGSDMTIDSFLAALAAYGIEGSMSGGIVTLESTNGAYATGDVITALGIGTTSTTTTQTIGTSHSSGALTATYTIVANGNTTFGDLGISGSATVYGIDGTTLGSVGVGSDTTIDSFLASLASYGIEGSMSGGVVSLSSTNGAYATGSLIDALGIGTTSTTSVETVGTSTSGGAITYETVTYATTYPTLTRTLITTSTVVTTDPVIGTQTVTVRDTVTVTEPVIGTQTITVDHTHTSTVAEIGTQTITVSDTVTVPVANVGAQTLLITHTHVCTEAVVGSETIYITSSVVWTSTLTRMTTISQSYSTNVVQNFSTTIAVATETTITIEGSSTLTTEVLATEDTTLGMLGITGGLLMVQIYDSAGSGGDGLVLCPDDSLEWSSENTIGEVLDAINGAGLSATLSNGVITIKDTSGSSSYGVIEGTLAEALGITVITSTTDGGTYETALNSWPPITRTTTTVTETVRSDCGEYAVGSFQLYSNGQVVCDTSTTLDELFDGYGNSGLSIYIYDYGGSDVHYEDTIVSGSSTVGEVLALFDSYITYTGEGNTITVTAKSNSNGQYDLQELVAFFTTGGAWEATTELPDGGTVTVTTTSSSTATGSDLITDFGGSPSAMYTLAVVSTVDEDGNLTACDTITITSSNVTFDDIAGYLSAGPYMNVSFEDGIYTICPDVGYRVTLGSAFANFANFSITECGTYVNEDSVVKTNSSSYQLKYDSVTTSTSTSVQTITGTGTYTINQQVTTPVTWSFSTVVQEVTGTKSVTSPVVATITVDNVTTTVVTHQTVTTTVVEKTTTAPVTYTVSDTFTVNTVSYRTVTHNLSTTMTVENTTTKEVTYTVEQTFTVENTSTTPVTITVYGTAVYDTTTVTVTPTTSTVSMTGQTKFSQIGQSASVSGVCHGQAFSVSGSGDDTINDFLTALAGFGISGEVSGGVLTLTCANGSYITSASGLGLSSAYTTQTHTITTNDGAGDALSYTLTSAMTSATTFTKLGGSASFTVVSDGKEYSVSASGEDTVGDLIDTLAGLGIKATISGGVLTLEGDEQAYVTASTGVFNMGSAYTTTVHTITTNDGAGDLQSYSTTVAMTASSTFEKLGDGATFTVVSDGVEHVVSASGTQTVGDLIDTLAGLGIKASISGGVLTLEGDEQAYVVGSTGVFNMGSAYTTTVHTITTNDGAGDLQSYSTTVAMTASSTFEKLGDGATFTVVSDGVQHVVSASGTQTVGDLIDTLAGLGIKASISGGVLTLEGDEQAYVVGSTGVFNMGSAYTTTVHTITTNTSCDLQSYTTTDTMTTSMTMEELGGSATINVYSRGQDHVVTVSGTDTVGDLIDQLAALDIKATVTDGVLTLKGDEYAWVTGASGVFGLNSAYTTTIHTITTNTSCDLQSYTTTDTMTTSMTMEELGGSATINVYSRGQDHVVTVSGTDTVGDLIDQLAALDIKATVENGILTLKGDEYAWVTGASGVFGLSSAYTTTVHTITTNTSGDSQYYETTDTMTTESTFKNYGGGGSITVFTDGKEVTISVGDDDTLDDLFTQLAAHGIEGRIENGIVYLTGDNEAYITAISGLTGLKLGTVNYTVTEHTTIDNTDSNEQKEVITAVADGTTELQFLRHPDGAVVPGYQFILSTTSDAGNELVTINFAATDTVYDVIDTLANYGINASIDNLGRFAVSSSSLTDFDISGTLGTFMMGAYVKKYDEGRIDSVSTNLIQQTIVNMDDFTQLSKLNITSGNITLYKDGTNHTIAIDNNITVGDFRNILAEYGITSDIIDGKLQLRADGVVYLTTPTGGSNLVTVMGLEHANWDLGDYSQESDYLTDTQTILHSATMDDKLYELTDDAGNDLGVTAGQIYVYQDGTRNILNINTNDTLQDLSNKLSQYGIAMDISENGRIYLDGNNNSYLTTDGIASGSASNILTKFNILNNWTTRYDSTSETLDYEVESDVLATGDTKLSDLQDADGNNLGITEGSYYVYQNGVRSTEEVTEDTTLNDLRATMALYGMTTDFNEDGSMYVGGYDQTYLATSATGGADTNAIDILFEQWNFVNVYTSNNLEIPQDVIISMHEGTKLADINEGTYQPGYITVVKDGVQTDIELTADDTVGDLMDELELYGFESVINANGQLIIKNTGNSLLQAYVGANTASNALDLLGIDLNNWIQTNSYESGTVSVTTTTPDMISSDRETLLSEMGVTTGEFYLYKDGVKYTSYISTDETLGSFIDKLKEFGIETSLVDTGAGSILSIEGSGNCYIATSASTNNASNVVDQLFTVPISQNYKYTGEEKTSREVTTYSAAQEDTLLSYYDNGGLKAEGELSVTVDGVTNSIQIGADETIGALLAKFNVLGLDASLTSEGHIIVQSGYKELLINTAGTTSNVMDTLQIQFVDDLGGYSASGIEVEQTTIEDLVLSVSNYADYGTAMKLLNIADGTLTLYRDGEKATLNIDSEQTFGDLRAQIAGRFADVDIKFEDGYLTFFSTTNGVSVEVGATTDTSNFSAVTGITSTGDGAVKSARELYCVNGSTVLTTAGLFRNGDIKAGTFSIGDAEFTITDDTTLSGIIGQINASDASNASAYWDSVDGKLVIKSRTTGAALVNIEAGTSNFTDVMGLTKSEWADADGNGQQDIGLSEATVTKMNVAAQEVGDNARFSINGTYYTSTSNTVGSDVSRIKGVTINLKGVSTDGETTLTVERDKESVANAVSDIVDAYNDLIENVDKEIAKGAALDDQFTLKLVRNQIRNLMTSSLAGAGVFKNLDQVGISLNAATAGDIRTDNINVLNFDKDKFLKAFDADRDALKDLLVGTETNQGVFTRVETLVEQALTSSYGYFSSAEKSYNTQIQRLDNKIKKANEAVERYRERLEAKFASMDLLISNMQNQYSSFLGV